MQAESLARCLVHLLEQGAAVRASGGGAAPISEQFWLYQCDDVSEEEPTDAKRRPKEAARVLDGSDVDGSVDETSDPDCL